MCFLIWVIKDPKECLHVRLNPLSPNIEVFIRDYIEGEKLFVIKFDKLHVKDLEVIEEGIKDFDPIMIIEKHERFSRYLGKLLKAS
jgi:hypothetical protein